MGHTVRSKLVPQMIGHVVRELDENNWLIKISGSHYICGHKDYWERVL